VPARYPKMLKKTFRLGKTREFFQTKRLGKKYYGTNFSVLVKTSKDPTQNPKVSVVAPNKIASNIPKRNHIKRLYIESMRLNLAKFPKGHNFIFYCNGSSQGKTYEEINADILKFLQNYPFTLS